MGPFQLADPTGPLAWADRHGLEAVVDELARVAETTGDPLADPADGLERRARSGGSFRSTDRPQA
jgi:hypothetical protein